MLNVKVAAWILIILLVLGCIISIIKEAFKSDSNVFCYIIAYAIKIYLYYCVGIFALL